MTTAPNIMETVSENTPKPKRGRPKGIQRTTLDSLPGAYAPDGCNRTQLNKAFAFEFAAIVEAADAEDQRKVIGCTTSDIIAGAGRFPRGYQTCATEIGRYLQATGNTATNRQSVLDVVIDGLDRGFGWKNIRAHFRQQRLGDKGGNALSLLNALALALDNYVRNFPGTTKQQKIGAITSLLEIIEEGE